MIAWIILAPLFGALINGILFASGLSRRFLGGSEHEEKRIVGIIGCGVVLISALISSFLFFKLETLHPQQKEIIQELYIWIPSGDFAARFEFLFDSLSCVPYRFLVR